MKRSRTRLVEKRNMLVLSVRLTDKIDKKLLKLRRQQLELLKATVVQLTDLTQLESSIDDLFLPHLPGRKPLLCRSLLVSKKKRTGAT